MEKAEEAAHFWRRFVPVSVTDLRQNPSSSVEDGGAAAVDDHAVFEVQA